MKNKKIYNLLFEQEESPSPQSDLKDPPEGNVSYKGNPTIESNISGSGKVINTN